MEFKHYATDEIIKVEQESDKVVFDRKNNKYYRLAKDTFDRIVLSKTSYIKI